MKARLPGSLLEVLFLAMKAPSLFKVWSRRITNVGDGLTQETEALTQGLPLLCPELSGNQLRVPGKMVNWGLLMGLEELLVRFIFQPVSGALDYLSGASCARIFEDLNNITALQRIRNPQAIYSDDVLKEYDERQAVGQENIEQVGYATTDVGTLQYRMS